MGQVPAVENLSASKILVVGDGHLASALVAALKSKASLQFSQTRFSHWSRASGKPLSSVVSEADPTHVWLAISDSALADFAKEHFEILRKRIVVHFAGSLPSFSFVYAAHPLMTFASPLSADSFSKIPFILDLEGPALSELMPGFTNKFFRLDPEDRTYYHALCAISGNFTVMLWESVASRFENELGLPRDALAAFRAQTFQNLAEAGEQSVLSGPIARGDIVNIQRHRQALFGKYEMPLLKIYDGFLDLFRTVRTFPSKETK